MSRDVHLWNPFTAHTLCGKGIAHLPLKVTDRFFKVTCWECKEVLKSVGN